MARILKGPSTSKEVLVEEMGPEETAGPPGEALETGLETVSTSEREHLDECDDVVKVLELKLTKSGSIIQHFDTFHLSLVGKTNTNDSSTCRDNGHYELLHHCKHNSKAP